MQRKKYQNYPIFVDRALTKLLLLPKNNHNPWMGTLDAGDPALCLYFCHHNVTEETL